MEGSKKKQAGQIMNSNEFLQYLKRACNEGSLVPCDISSVKNTWLLQSKEWAKLKSSFSWTACAYTQTLFPKLEPYIVILLRSVSPYAMLAYIPDGIFPNTTSYKLEEDSQDIDALTQDLEDAMLLLSMCVHDMSEKYPKLLCLRWDPPWNLIKPQDKTLNQWPSYTRVLDYYKTFNLKYSASFVSLCSTVQAPATVVLSLNKSENELLLDMKSKTRYNVRLGEKKGLEILQITMQEFYELYKATSARNKISIHSEAYYNRVEEIFKESQHYQLCIYAAKFEAKIIAAVVIIMDNDPQLSTKTAIYLYGASSDEHRNLMPMYALQWHAIKEAKHLGCDQYDMFGMSVDEDPHDRMYGLYKFKTGFGGKIQLRVGGLEITSPYARGGMIRHLLLKMFKLVESLRLWYYYKYKKR